MKHLVALAFLALPAAAFSGELIVEDAFVPVPAPGAKAHAGYMMIMNKGDTAVRLIGVSADGYGVAHIHKSEVANDVAMMSMVDMVEIGAGQTVMLEQGGLHIMLMKPEAVLAQGDIVTMTLEFADGSTHAVEATVKPMTSGMQGGHSGHGS